MRGGSDLISPDVEVYFRDCYDHVIQLLDIVENHRELASGLMDVYMSSVSNKMNEVIEGINDHFHHFYPTLLCCWCLRDELREYAGVGVAVGLLCLFGFDVCDRL